MRPTSEVPSKDYLRSLLAMPHFIVAVARRGGEVVGGLAAYELQKFERDRREIYIDDRPSLTILELRAFDLVPGRDARHARRSLCAAR